MKTEAGEMFSRSDCLRLMRVTNWDWGVGGTVGGSAAYLHVIILNVEWIAYLFVSELFTGSADCACLQNIII